MVVRNHFRQCWLVVDSSSLCNSKNYIFQLYTLNLLTPKGDTVVVISSSNKKDTSSLQDKAFKTYKSTNTTNSGDVNPEGGKRKSQLPVCWSTAQGELMFWPVRDVRFRKANNVRHTQFWFVTEATWLHCINLQVKTHLLIWIQVCSVKQLNSMVSLLRWKFGWILFRKEIEKVYNNTWWTLAKIVHLTRFSLLK